MLRPYDIPSERRAQGGFLMHIHLVPAIVTAGVILVLVGIVGLIRFLANPDSYR